MRHDPSLRFSILKGIRYISHDIVQQARHESGVTSFLFVAMLCVDFMDFILAQAGSFSRKICTHRHSAPLAQPISLYKRCPPVPTSWMLVDFTGRRKISGKSHQILVSPKYVHLVVQPLASSLTKMAAPANNRKQFPLRAASADAPLAMRSQRVLLRLTSFFTNVARMSVKFTEYPVKLQKRKYQRIFSRCFLLN